MSWMLTPLGNTINMDNLCRFMNFCEYNKHHDLIWTNKKQKKWVYMAYWKHLVASSRMRMAGFFRSALAIAILAKNKQTNKIILKKSFTQLSLIWQLLLKNWKKLTDTFCFIFIKVLNTTHLCFCPPDTVTPLSPRTVWYPCGIKWDLCKVATHSTRTLKLEYNIIKKLLLLYLFNMKTSRLNC